MRAQPDPVLHLQDYAIRHRKRGNGFGCTLCGPGDVARTLSARCYKDGSEILIGCRRGNPRRLTLHECARLMGFELSGSSAGFQIPVSDSRACKQFGNAVAVPVMRAIAGHLAPLLRSCAREGHRKHAAQLESGAL